MPGTLFRDMILRHMSSKGNWSNAGIFKSVDSSFNSSKTSWSFVIVLFEAKMKQLSIIAKYLSIKLYYIEAIYRQWQYKCLENIIEIKLMKAKALRKQSLHGKIAAWVLLKLFISGNVRCNSTDAPSAFLWANNIQSMIPEDQKTITKQLWSKGAIFYSRHTGT